MTARVRQSRRDFLKHTAAVAGTGIVAAAATRSAKARTFSANDRIGVGMIGLGGMGSVHLDGVMTLGKNQGERVDVVAVCDALQPRLEAAATKSGAKPYKVWTDLLADKQVDAVLVATPDHWHAPLTLAALEAGKDVYCEKPMTHYDHLDLAKKVVETVASKQRVMQVGTQLIQEDCWKLVKENVSPLGPLLHAESSDCKNWPYESPVNDPEAAGIVPGKTLDWDMWQGCELTRMPKRPYDLLRFACFRDFWDYSGGPITDQLPHVLTPWVFTLNLGLPKRILAAGGVYYHKYGREAPDTVHVLIEYESGPMVSVLASLASGKEGPKMIRGQKAALTVRSPIEIEITPEGEDGKAGQQKVVKGKEKISFHEHWRNFLDCIRTRNKPTSNEQIGYRVMAALSAAVRSYRSGKAVGFDPQQGTIKEL